MITYVKTSYLVEVLVRTQKVSNHEAELQCQEYSLGVSMLDMTCFVAVKSACMNDSNACTEH